MADTAVPARVRFGVFVLDPASGDLWKQGIRIRLQGKPLEVLRALLERPGTLVGRKELQERLWAADTHVEFENGLNNAISRLREALGDSADSPRFVETVPRRGYRFIAPVALVEAGAPGTPAVHGSTARSTPTPLETGPSAATRVGRWPLAIVGALAVVAAGAALWWWLATAEGPRARSVAVLPFVTAAPGHTALEEYVAFGIADAITAELARAGGLDVISQTSSLRYRGTDKSLPEIARELGVGAVVEGSVVREGGDLRITVQLIAPERDTHLWADTFRRDADGILGAHGDLARSVARTIRRELTGDAPARVVEERAADPRVREAYLKGRYFMSLATEDGRSRALRFFEEAIAIDPRHAESHAGVADYYIVTDAMPTEVAIPRARAAAERALALDPDLADAHVTLAFLHYYGDWDWAAAERQFVRALDLRTTHTRGRRWYAQFLAAMGRATEATGEAERALALDPVSLNAQNSAAQVWLHTRQVDRLLEQGRHILELHPHNAAAHEHIAAAHMLRGEDAEAVAAIEQGRARSDGDPLFVAFLAFAHGLAGRTTEARVARDELQRVADRGFVPPFLLAMAHLGAGDREAALTALELGYQERDSYLVFLRASPWMDTLRREPRFETIVRSLSFP